MADQEFELEHWKSRATAAERERDSARSVLARLRGHFRNLDGDMTLETPIQVVRERLKKHDREWWTQAHAMNAVAEAISGIEDE